MKKKFDVDKWFNPSKELSKACEFVRYFRMDINLDAETSKKCAIKIVDELIDYSIGTDLDFFRKVKHEIEKL